MKDEKQEAAPETDVDGALFKYLNDMLHNPAAAALTAIANSRSKPAAPPARPDLPTAGNVRLLNPGSGTLVADKTICDTQRRSWLSPGLLSAAQPTPARSTAVPTSVKVEPPKPVAPAPENADRASADQRVEIPPQTSLWCENGRPAWAQQQFECLIFTVNGLKLAVPLISLGSIQPLDKKLTHLPGQPDWFMGILTASIGNLKVLNTALCVMPERYQAQSHDALRYVITIHNSAWGLACDSVEQSISLHPDQVKWRSQRGKRPWLAGTVVEYMCSLVDTDGFHEFLI